MGDFNTSADDPILSETLVQPDVCDAIAELGLDDNETQRIDWILTKGFKAIDGKMLAKGVSDHPYYQVILQYV